MRRPKPRGSILSTEDQLTPASPAATPDLRAAVAQELAAAVARLPERQQEVLALREERGLAYAEIAAEMKIEESAVPSLLARARLRLRAERRGVSLEPASPCEERDRALRLLAAIQDSEPVEDEAEGWLYEHLAACPGCDGAYAAMLESSGCYRAWR